MVLVLALPATGSGVLTTASPAPSYMSGLGDRFEVKSSGRFTDAREFTVFSDSNSLNKPAGRERERYTSIWTETCKPHKQQTATFRRKIDIPGPPANATFEISPEFGAFANPLKRYKLEINGAKAFDRSLGKISGSANRATLGPKQLKQLRDGVNDIELTVKRDELPEAVRRCNRSKKNRVAVFFSLNGYFAADVGLVEPPPPTAYKRASSPSRTIVVNLSVFNHGPSALVAGAGTFTASASGFDQMAVAGTQGDPLNPQVVPLGPPFENCQLKGFTVDCGLTHFPSQDSGVLSIYAQRKFSNTDFEESSSYITWRTRSGPVPDPRLDNDDRQVQIVWCGDRATSPGCAGAQ
jgi:hypothetical protein